MQEPTLLTLEEWGGTPNGWAFMTLPATELWVHHSVTNEDIGVLATDDAKSDFQELDRIGLSQGNGGIPYSYAIHPNGIIGEGQTIHRGAHTGGKPGNGDATAWGHNPHAFGVCFVGNYSDEGGDQLTSAAVKSFQWLRDFLLYFELLAPGVYPTGGHRDAPGNSTGCPGNAIEADLGVLRLPHPGPAPPPLPTLFAKEPKMFVMLCKDKPPTMIARIGLEKWDAYEVEGAGTAPTVEVTNDQRTFIINAVRGK